MFIVKDFGMGKRGGGEGGVCKLGRGTVVVFDTPRPILLIPPNIMLLSHAIVLMNLRMSFFFIRLILVNLPFFFNKFIYLTAVS